MPLLTHGGDAHPLEEADLEPERRIHLGGRLHDGVGHPGQLLELVGAAPAGLHVRQGPCPVSPRQYAERQLRQVVRVLRTASLSRVVAHRSPPSACSTADRSRMRAVRMRVLAVPSGMPSDSLISDAVLP